MRQAGSTVYFRNTQRGKRSMMLDLKQPQALEIFMKLAETADVILESFRPGVVDRLGVGYEAVKARAPRIIYCSISAYGQDGPSRDRPTHDLGIQAEVGLLSANVGSDGKPTMPAVPAADVAASLMALNGILMALLERERSGEGQWVQTSLLQALIALLDFQAARWLVSGEIPEQAGNNHPTAIPTGVFRTSDGYITIAASGNLFERLCAAIEAPELLKHPDYADFKLRSKNTSPCLSPRGDRLPKRRRRADETSMQHCCACGMCGGDVPRASRRAVARQGRSGPGRRAGQHQYRHGEHQVRGGA